MDSWYAVKRCEGVLHQYLSYFQEDCLSLLELEELQLLRLRPCRGGRAVQRGFRPFQLPSENLTLNGRTALDQLMDGWSQTILVEDISAYSSETDQVQAHARVWGARK